MVSYLFHSQRAVSKINLTCFYLLFGVGGGFYYFYLATTFYFATTVNVVPVVFTAISGFSENFVNPVLTGYSNYGGSVFVIAIAVLSGSDG